MRKNNVFNTPFSKVFRTLFRSFSCRESSSVQPETTTFDGVRLTFDGFRVYFT